MSDTPRMDKACGFPTNDWEQTATLIYDEGCKLERENAALREVLADTLNRLEFYVECLPMSRSTYEKTTEGQVTAQVIERARAARAKTGGAT